MTQTFGPYSSYQKAGDFIYTAGQVGVVDGNIHPDIAEQTTQALENLHSVLVEAGTDLGHVVKTTVYLTDMEDFEKMNEAYKTVFEAAGAKPARTTVGVKELPRIADNPLRVEIEAVAYVGANS